MNKLLMSFALLILISCSDEKKKQTSQTLKENNHIKFLSIGNGYYLDDDSKNVNSFINVPGANSSTNYFTDYLSNYGSGLTLKSTNESLLSKEIMLQYIDSIINIAVKDSMSTTFIYYCGHGFSDKEGNIYLVPGNHRYNEKQASTMESLLSINEIQQRIIDVFLKTYPASKTNEQAANKFKTSLIEFSKKSAENEQFQEGNQFLKKTWEDIRKSYSGLIRPRFVLLVDCCTDKINTVNYSLLLNKKVKKDFEESESKLKGLKNLPNGFGKFISNRMHSIIENVKYNSSVGSLKAQFWMAGNRTVYTADVGKPAQMVISPVDEEELIGPICRRVMLFFRDRKSFNISQLLTSLNDEKFDDKTPPPKVEEGNIMNWFSSNPMALVQKYKTTIGDNMFLDKRDSVNYVSVKSQ